MIREQFQDLCSKTERAYAGPDLEPALVEVLRLAESHPEARSELAGYFLDLVRHPEKGPWEVVQYCMHGLRWPEVRAAVEEDLERAKALQDWRAIPILSHSLAAFDPAWDDADLYGTYRCNGGDPAGEKA